jgi:hypothetical protein
MLGRLGIKSQILRIAHPRNPRVDAQAAAQKSISRTTTATTKAVDDRDIAMRKE